MNGGFVEVGSLRDEDRSKVVGNIPDAHSPNTPPNGSRQNEPEVTWDQSTSSVTTDVEAMTLELGDGRVKVESESLTSMADSTMRDGLVTADTSDSVVIRCCIERIKPNLSTSSVGPSAQSKDIERDYKVVVPSDTAVGDLVQTVLERLHYSEMDLQGARGMIVIKNWKPMTLDAITDDPLLRIGDLLTGLSALVTLRIQLRCFAKYRQMDEVKEKLLYYLLRNSQELLQTTGCPIIKTEFEEILGDAEDKLPEDMRTQFNDWYGDQMKYRRMRPTVVQSAVTNGPFPIRKELQKREPNADMRSDVAVPSGRVTLPVVKSLGRLWPDHDGEYVRLKHCRKDGTLSRRDGILTASHRGTEVAPKNYNESRFTSVDRRSASMESKTVNAVVSRPGSTALLKDEKRELGVKQESSEDELERVPELPNRNAVYVIRPFPISSSGSDSAEVILADSDASSSSSTSSSSNEDVYSTPPLPRDLSKTVSSSSAPSEINSCKDHGKYFLTDRATALDHLPTNLSVRDISRSSHQRDERTVSKADNALDRNNSNSVGAPIKPNGNDTDTRKSDKAYINDRCSPKQLPQPIHPSAFGLVHHHHNHHQRHHHNHQHQQAAASHLLALSQTMNFMRRLHGPPLPIHQPFQDCINDSSTSDGDQRKRSRVFIDPISETPRLEEWFAVDSHPSTATIEELTAQLNRSVYRQRFPRLEPKNVQLWFKNHRAKVKRLKGELTTNGRL